jgi:LPXTG-site transpeptidase (sortase) family protein
LLLVLFGSLLHPIPAQARSLAACLNNITVTNSNDSGAGSLRQAVAAVCSGGTIDFGSLTGTINLSSSISIDLDLTIAGPGADTLSIEGGDGSRLFVVSSGVTATIQDLTLAHGSATEGGAILNQGTLTILASAFSHNSSNYGGAINNPGTLVIEDSTLSQNSAIGAGGALDSTGNATITNSTFSQNSAPNGGAIYGSSTATVTIFNATISENTNNGNRSQLQIAGILNFSNTVIGKSSGGWDCDAGTLGTNANNLIKDGGCSASLSGDPLFGVLGDYGGSTQTVPLLPGSPAIDAGSGCESKDQRGKTRGTCDIGAFESGGFTLAITSGDNQSAATLSTYTDPLVLSVSAKTTGEPVNGGKITITSPSGFNPSLDTSPIRTSIVEGAASQEVKANLFAGNFTVNAGASGANTLSYSLKNIGNVMIMTIFHDASHNYITSAPVGSYLHTTLKVSGFGSAEPSGSLTPTIYTNTSCSGSGTSLSAVTIAADGWAHPGPTAQMGEDGLSYIMHYSGDSIFAAGDSLCRAFWKTEYPTVLELATNTVPKNGASLSSGPPAITLQFSQNMLHTSATDEHSVTYPLNYLLVQTGPNQLIDTEACGPSGLQPDDKQIVVDSVSYDADTFQARLQINHGVKLTPGRYRLFICGTTSIWDNDDSFQLNNGESDSTLDFTILAATPSPTPSPTSVPTPTATPAPVHKLPKTGFAPSVISSLPAQPAAQRYTASNMWLEIPQLAAMMPIVGVPQIAAAGQSPAWDVTWLEQQAGYLAGTTFPTWAGNSVITGHLTGSDGNAGPFANLARLAWGDRVVIHAWGQRYIFEVRSVDPWVSPDDTSLLTRHETTSWITLLTCRSFNPLTGSYDWRTAVRAVLVSIWDE